MTRPPHRPRGDARRFVPAEDQDHVHIDVARDDDVRYWARRFAVAPEAVRHAVDAVGPLAYAVERFLEAHAGPHDGATSGDAAG